MNKRKPTEHSIKLFNPVVFIELADYLQDYGMDIFYEANGIISGASEMESLNLEEKNDGTKQ